jgi:hypothetical protein
MARLVLGVAGAVVGAYFGNPALGFAIGSAIGGAVDPATTKAQGPRLNDLRVQGSAYGAPIPRPYGAMRLAGQVVWSGGIREHQETESQSSKGGPQVETTSYTYTASFAVQLCAGPIGGVRRIWADARLIWSAASDQPLASALASGAIGEKITLYPGTADQAADPIIEADKGVGATPAYRHRALLVFEDLDLAPYGNRIPNIEAEVVSAAAGVTASAWIRPAADTFGLAYCFPLRFFDDGARASVLYPYRFFNQPHIINRSELLAVPDPAVPGSEIIRERAYRWRELPSGFRIAGVGAADGETVPLLAPPGSGGIFGLLYDWEGVYYSGGVLLDNQGAGRWRWRDGWLAISHGTGVYVCRPTVGPVLASPADFSFSGLAQAPVSYPCGTGLQDCEIAQGYVWLLYGTAGGALELARAALPDGALEILHSEAWPGSQRRLARAAGALYILESVSGLLHVHSAATGARERTISLGSNPWRSVQLMAVHGSQVFVWWYDSNLNTSPPGFTRFQIDAYPAEGAAVGDIVAALCAEVGVPAVTSALAGRSVPGYVRTRPMSVRAALEPLQQAYWFDLVPRGAQLVAVARGGAPVATLTAEEYVAGQRPELSRVGDLELPRRVVVIYRARSRQYQEGSQQHQRLTGASQAESVVELPLALDDPAAAQIAEVLLRQAWIEREGLRLQLGPAHLALEPADRLTLPLAAGAYTVRLTGVALQPMLRLECEAAVEQATIYTPVSQGAAIDTLGDTVLARGPTALEMIDGPLLRDSDPDGVLYAAGYGLLPDWRGAALQSSSDGLLWHPEGALVQALVRGTLTVAPLATVSPDRVDEASRPEILITRGGLAGVTEALFWAAPPALLIGGELIAYRDAEDLGGGLWRLAYLLRALRGTEQAMAHAAGERCLLLDSALRPLAFDSAQLGLPRYWRAATLGRTAAPEALILTPAAAGLLPLAPCHLARADLGAGNWAISWLRRTRRGGAWRDGVDAALGEASEAYRVRVYAGAVLSSEATVATPAATVAGSAGHKVRVAQMSEAVGAGREAEITL